MSGRAGGSGPLADGVRAIAAHFGVPPADLSLAPQQGQVNLTVFLGADLVLRVPRKPAFEDRLAKEAAVIPVAQAAGVPTANLVTYDAGRSIADVSFMVLERMHGPTLSEFGYEPESSTVANASIGAVLAPLHRLRLRDVGPISGVAEPPAFSPPEMVQRLVEAGELGRTQGRWLLDWFDHLEALGARGSEPVLLHGDVTPANLVVDDGGRVTAIIDWGSAHWGEVVRDFADLPTRALPAVLAGCRSAARWRDGSGEPRGDDMSPEAGVLWYQLSLMLARLLGKTSTSEERNWSAPRQARLLELLRFLTGDPPSPWPDLFVHPPA